jgi:superfamily II DNA/RNA helicase
VSNKHFFSQKRWADLKPPLSKTLLSQMEQQRVCDGGPSRIQAASWGEIRKGVPVLMADQTGSGKTLAYLLPLFDQLLKEEEEAASSSSSSSSSSSVRFLSAGGGRVRALVLCPTTELAVQVSSYVVRIRISM